VEVSDICIKLLTQTIVPHEAKPLYRSYIEIGMAYRLQ